MATLTWILFESLPVLGGILFVVLFFLLVRWRSGGTPRPLLIGLAVAAVLLVVELLVVTNRERADAIMQPIERGLLAGTSQPLIDALHESFDTQQMDRIGFGEFVDSQLQRIKVVSLWRLETRMIDDAPPPGFVARLVYQGRIKSSGNDYALPSTWDLRFVQENGTWRIIEITPVKIAGRDISDWDAVRRMN